VQAEAGLMKIFINASRSLQYLRKVCYVSRSWIDLMEPLYGDSGSWIDEKAH